MSKPAFELTAVYRQEVARLLSARQESKLIHSAGDIDASGDQLEAAFREMLRRKLPRQYFVGHGHVVDESLAVSRQFDVIIADNSATPILFEAENGSQYFPWESVYAVGEIKSTYAKNKHYISSFAKNVENLKTTLKREPTPPNYLGNGVTLGTGLSTDESRPYRNPLFQFIVFFDSGNMTVANIAREYTNSADQNLPVISVFLDGKIVVKAELARAEGGGVKLGNIDLDPLRVAERADIDWMCISYTDMPDKGAHSVVAFMLGLFSHLNACVLMRPRVNNYLHAVLESARHQSEAVSLKGQLKIAELSGSKIPEGAISFLKYREAAGRSPFGKVSDKELQKYFKETGETEESLFASSQSEQSDAPSG